MPVKPKPKKIGSAAVWIGGDSIKISKKNLERIQQHRSLKKWFSGPTLNNLEKNLPTWLAFYSGDRKYSASAGEVRAGLKSIGELADRLKRTLKDAATYAAQLSEALGHADPTTRSLYTETRAIDTLGSLEDQDRLSQQLGMLSAVLAAKANTLPDKSTRKKGSTLHFISCIDHFLESDGISIKRSSAPNSGFYLIVKSCFDACGINDSVENQLANYLLPSRKVGG